MNVGGRIPASRMRAQSAVDAGSSMSTNVDARALRAEVLDDGGPDPGAAAGDEYPLVGEARILRESLAHDPVRSCSTLPYTLS